MTASTSKVVKARKRHWCSAFPSRRAEACTSWIEPGEVYKRTVWFPDDINPSIAVIETCSRCLDGDPTTEDQIREQEAQHLDALVEAGVISP